MRHTLHEMRAIEKKVTQAMAPVDLDPRLRSEMQCICDATKEANLALAKMGMIALEMLEEAAEPRWGSNKAELKAE